MAELATIEQQVEAQRDQIVANSDARSAAQEFLLRNMKDTLSAGQPGLLIVDGSLVWRVPIVFTRADRTFGEVGEVLVDAKSGVARGWTPSDEVYRNARVFLTPFTLRLSANKLTT